MLWCNAFEGFFLTVMSVCNFTNKAIWTMDIFGTFEYYIRVVDRIELPVSFIGTKMNLMLGVRYAW